ncbi:MAG: metalloregulator ArsR/SmtB family transcription factor [Magnetospirillum sp. WYHS-4]
MARSREKQILLDEFAAVGKALASPHRVYLLDILAQGERSVERLAEAASMSVASASQHLQHLRQAGMVSTRRNGTQILYRLSGEDILPLMEALRVTGRRHRQEIQNLVDGYLKDRDGMEPVSRLELMQRMRDHEVLVLDVRPEDEFQSGHIAGAVNLPIRALMRRLKDLPKNVEIVAYCRGEYCLFAYDAVALLRKKGYRARRLEQGFPEWRSQGLPVEVTP